MRAIETGMKIISSREIAVATDKDHKNVIADIRTMCEQACVEIVVADISATIDNQEVIVIESEYEADQGMGRTRLYKEYLLNEMAAELLGTGYDVKRRLAVLRLVREMKEALEKQFVVIQTMKKEQLKESFSLTEVAQAIKTKADFHKLGRTKIFQELKRRGILNSKNRPYQKYVNEGYFLIVPLPNNKYVTKVQVTEEGKKWITNMFFPEAGNYDQSELKKLIMLTIEAQQVYNENILCSKSGTGYESERTNILHKLAEVNNKLKLALEGNSPKALE